MVWITTDDISEEAWANLLEFANIEVSIEAIASKHGSISKKNKTNYRKQAEQIRSSILQAKEYFDAAQSSSLVTSPNHLYYGMVSLFTSSMLMLGDGTKSLDSLRKDKRNGSHGLGFTTSVNDSNCNQNLEILRKSFVEIKDRGFFNNWHTTLPKKVYSFGVINEVNTSSGMQTRRGIVGEESLLDFAEIQSTKLSILDLLNYLPDLNSSLIRYGVSCPSSRMDYDMTINQAQQSQSMSWRIHAATSENDLDEILKRFEIDPSSEFQFEKNISSNKLSCAMTLNTTGQAKFSYPSFRETINNEKIVYPIKEFQRHELVDMFLAAYGLSMLSRYYPDLWLKCIESHCKATKLIERLVRSLIKKTPLMALSLIHGNDYVISNHRPTWHL